MDKGTIYLIGQWTLLIPGFLFNLFHHFSISAPILVGSIILGFMSLAEGKTSHNNIKNEGENKNGR